MKTLSTPTALALALALLTSCTSVSTGPLALPLQERLRNPLVAERYWAEMAEHMADFARRDDVIAKDPVKATIIEAERTRALQRVAQARTVKKEGTSGMMLAIHPFEDAEGEVLLRSTTLFFGTTFLTAPNPSVSVLLTTVVDPRDVRFPDKTSVNLGELQTAYGAQQYEIPDGKGNGNFRTAVLYDTRLDRVVGFAQLSK